MRESTRIEESDEEEIANNSIRRNQPRNKKPNRGNEEPKREKIIPKSSQESLAYVVQLIHSLREKVDNLGQEVPNRS
jgi:hypothetical protein